MHEWKYVSVAPGIILFCWVLTVSSHDETSSVLAHDALKLCAHSDVEHPRHYAVNRQVCWLAPVWSGLVVRIPEGMEQVLFGDGIVQETLLAWYFLFHFSYVLRCFDGPDLLPASPFSTQTCFTALCRSLF